MRSLNTKWTDKVTPENAHREYPRPDMYREGYICLNGMWDYTVCVDDSSTEVYSGRILVPFSPEAPLSGVGRILQPNETAYYKKNIELSDSYIKNSVLLHFGAVDQYAEVSVNGHTVCEHTGGYTPFEADISNFVVPGQNEITVKVSDLSDTSFHARGKQMLKHGGMFYTPQSGIWQTVWLEAVPKSHICSYSAAALVDGKTIIIDVSTADGNESVNSTECACHSEAVKNEVEITVFEANIYEEDFTEADPFASGKVLVTDRFNVCEGYKLTLPEAKRWSPDSPFLYRFVLRYGDDEVRGYFAVRTLSVGSGADHVPRLLLNGQPLFQNGVLDQGYWPDGLYTPPCDEALLFDIETMKSMGFNMLRKHAKVELSRWYYHCDRIGMLVWQDIVNGGTSYNMVNVTYLPTISPNHWQKRSDNRYRSLSRESSESREQYKRDLAETVRALYNHPCIVLWVPFNEGWGQFDSLEATEYLRSLDSTRFIDHASGWFDQGGGDVCSRHIYFNSFKFKADRRPTVLSEFGGFVCRIGDHSCTKKVYGYRIYKSTESLQEAFEALYKEKIAPNMDILCATVYTQISDIEEEVNGIMTYDRKIIKLDKDRIHRMNTELCYRFEGLAKKEDKSDE